MERREGPVPQPAERSGRRGLDGPGQQRCTTVRFTAADWPRVRFGELPAPLVETVLGIAELRRQPRRSRWAFRARSTFPSAASPLLDLIPPSGPWPTFLDPALPDLSDALDIVAGTPPARLHTELARTWRHRGPPPSWVRDLVDGDRDALRLLIRALRAFYLACVAPCWPEIVMSFRTDVAERMTVLAQGGLGSVFGTLHRDLFWRDGALERKLSSVGEPGEFWLDGSGLTILPSPLWTGPPLFALSGQASGGSVVVYAARRRTDPDMLGHPEALAALIGRTRAAVLGALRSPSSTAELAAQVGISAPSASEHAAVLRDADLIETIRTGRGVRHSLTPLGRSLLDGRDFG